MTLLSDGKTVTRETLARYRGRSLVVTVTGHEVLVREKGRQSGVAVPILAVLECGYKILARESAVKKALGRGRKR